MMQSPHRLWNDLKCVEWDVKPCSIQSNLSVSNCFLLQQTFRQEDCSRCRIQWLIHCQEHDYRNTSRQSCAPAIGFWCSRRLFQDCSPCVEMYSWHRSCLSAGILHAAENVWGHLGFSLHQFDVSRVQTAIGRWSFVFCVEQSAICCAQH